MSPATRHPDLEVSLHDMSLQSALYRPSVFWHDASTQIVEEINREGLEGFRRLPTPLDYFVPTFGSRGNGLNQQQVSKMSAIPNFYC